ncbi:CDP-glycerol glycerophosphotransferase family protein [Patescibacteria group bacterium]|nr:CDP-glycerol glycerophosphotransferase family protein [Patescibacteria group bacterium]
MGFVVYYPFHFYVYKNIYKHLLHKAEFIIDAGPFLPAEQPQELIEEIIALLEKEGVPYRLLRAEDYRYPEYLRRFFKKYEALITVWHRGCTLLEETDHCKKINAVYGVGKELNAVRPAQSNFDIALVYGERPAQMHQYFTHPVIVGNPKFDDWFNGTLDEVKILQIKEKLDPRKKTLLYVPTHGDLSSVDQLAGELDKVAEFYNIIAKPHYYTRREEPERIKLLGNQKFLLLNDEEEDLLPLLKVADIVLSDNSSVIFDAVLVDKPVIVADFWDTEFLDFAHKELRKTRLGKKAAATFSDSIEQEIKKKGIIPTIQKPSDLGTMLIEVLQDDGTWQSKRQTLSNSLFSFKDGDSGKRAAQAIEACVADKADKKYHIVFHAVEAYKRQIGKLSFMREKRLLQEIERYKSYFLDEIESKNAVFYSVIFLHPKTASEKNFSFSIRALIEQSFPSSQYEIFVVGASEEYCASIIGELPLSNKILPNIYSVPEAGSQGINTALQKSTGSIICFTDSVHMVPADWVEQLHLGYRQFPNSAGIGGYATPIYKNYTLYDEYSHYQLGKRLRVEKEAFFLSRMYVVTNNVFSQNPAGNLSNMSYKKASLPFIPPTFSEPTMLATYLKAVVIKNENITFLPFAVSRQEPVNLRVFLSNVKAQAFANAAIGRMTAQLTGTKNFFQLFSEPVQVLFRYRKVFAWKAIAFSALTFLGSLYEWLGKVTAFTQFFKYKFDQKLKDTEMLVKTRS